MPPSLENVFPFKSLLGTEFLQKGSLDLVLGRAQEIKGLLAASRPIERVLVDKTVILFFFEASTRTRSSFELAAKRLGATTLLLGKDMSSTVKGETLIDTARTIEAMSPDLLVIRHPSAGSAHALDARLKIPIINAGDGFHEHPTQALLDLFTILEFKKRLSGLSILIVGDIAHSRVARSNIYALRTMGAKVRICGPPTLIPPSAERMGIEVFYDLEQAVIDQDVIIGLRIQYERLGPGQIPSRGEYSRFYGLNGAILSRCKEDVLIMHPGPVNRGLEISPEVADGSKSVILNQVSNGVIVRMAVLEILAKGGG